jgi:hypothetical protein
MSFTPGLALKTISIAYMSEIVLEAFHSNSSALAFTSASIHNENAARTARTARANTHLRRQLKNHTIVNNCLSLRRFCLNLWDSNFGSWFALLCRFFWVFLTFEASLCD